MLYTNASDFHGGNIVLPIDTKTRLMVPTHDAPKARACVMGMYEAYNSSRATKDSRMSFKAIREWRTFMKQTLGYPNVRFFVGSEVEGRVGEVNHYEYGYSEAEMTGRRLPAPWARNPRAQQSWL